MNRSVPTPRLEKVRRIAFYASERSEYASRVMEGVLRYVEDHIGFLVRDFQDDLTLSAQERTAFAHRPPPWNDWSPDGLIAILPHDPAVVRWVTTSDIPVVSLGGDYRSLLPTVLVDPASIAQLALEHFCECGYEHFAFVGIRDLVAVEGRCKSFRARLREASHPMLHYELQTNPWPGLYELEERAAAEPGLISFLQSAPKPLAVLATSDYVGRVICMACRNLGFQVPQEVGVLGIDNYAAARSSQPPLSSIHAPGQEVGFQAMTLLDRLSHERLTLTGSPAEAKPAPVEPPPTVVVPAVTLVPRQSTRNGKADSIIVRAMTLIRERACEGVAIEQILAELLVSRSTLERQFVAHVGRTPGQELLRVRLERAKELLRHTDLPVSRIAEMIGYERSSSFSDFFRKHAGTTPRAYRAGGAPDAS